ncbi:hypothetical protein G6F68_013623 [Rhizopus microsporus]|nr:hypothetical protein G6F68_013623 [Rhizopus microsporus]
MLARLHQASDSYHAPQRSTHVLVARDDLIRADDPIAAIKSDLATRPGLARYLARIPWEAQLRRDVLPWHSGLAERLRDEYGVNTDKLKRVPQHPEQVGKLGYEVPNAR